MSKLQTIDEIMEGREPGSVRVRQGHWHQDVWFAPHFRDHGGTWYGLSKDGYASDYPGNYSMFEIVRPTVAYYQWVVVQAEGFPYVPDFMYSSEEELRKDHTAVRMVRRLDHTRIEIEEDV